MTRRRKRLRPRLSFKSTHRRPDLSLLAVILFLLIIGAIFVYEASIVEAYHQFGDSLHFVRNQAKWGVFGLISLFISTFIPIDLVKKTASPVMFFSIFLLVIVLIPGLGSHVQGARRWLSIGSFTLQPSEITKLALIIYLSDLLTKTKKLLPFLAPVALASGLIMLQPDLGTTITLAASSLALFFVSGSPLLHLGLVAGSSALLALLLILTSSYRRARLLTFINPQSDPLGASYHIRQVIIALGSGGLLGTGLGRSLQKYRYLPEATTDSIFAVIAEETGFLGTIIVIGAFAFFAFKGLSLASRLADPFMAHLAAGLTLLIILQALLNLGAMSALVPLTGITLPFISYGGSSLIITLTASGLLLNLSRYTKQ